MLGLIRSVRTRLYCTESPVSGEIEVWQNGAERELLVNGSRQSIYRPDGSTRGYWKKLVPETEVKSVLILGLGGGTVAGYLRQRWPGIRIVGYELDPEVVRVATAYFDLDRETEVRTEDFREALKTKEVFDFIIVDLYHGSKFISEAGEERFIRSLPKKLNPGGKAAFNRSPVFSGKGELGEFEKALRLVFPKVRKEKADLNIIYWGQT